MVVFSKNLRTSKPAGCVKIKDVLTSEHLGMASPIVLTNTDRAH